MMSVTHAAIALSTASVVIGSANPFVLFTAAIGSQLPDLDTTESFTGRAFYPAAKWLEERYPHRTITHSFAASGVVALLGLPLLLIHWHYWLALVLGHFCGWFSDCFTKAGVAAFFPSPARLVIPGNPRARLESKSPAEYWVLAIACCLMIVSVNLISAGGISEQFGRSFFSDAATAAQTFHKYGSSQQVLIDVKGLNVRTSQTVVGRFEVIQATDNAVIAESLENHKLYKVGAVADAQIQPTLVKTILGKPITVKSQEVTVPEMGVAEWVSHLPGDAYLSGTLVLDDSSDAQIPQEIESFAALRTSGSQVELSNARPAQVASTLRDFWILSGKVVVKVRG